VATEKVTESAREKASERTTEVPRPLHAGRVPHGGLHGLVLVWMELEARQPSFRRVPHVLGPLLVPPVLP
jgi:hypothetical protein